jgi:hypothetical protein
VTFVVKVPRREFENPVMNRADLETIASLSKGKFSFLHDIADIPKKIEKKGQPIYGVENVHRLWDTWAAFIVFVGFLCVEWIYRKRQRLL